MKLKNKEEDFLVITLLRTLGASLLGDILSKDLSGKGVIRAGKEQLELVKEQLELVKEQLEVMKEQLELVMVAKGLP